MHVSEIKFPPTVPEFFPTLNKRVNEYFKSRNIDKHANAEMVWKTVFMFTLYFAPYAAMMVFRFDQVWPFLLLYLVMGLGKAGIGLSVMHDANHGAYSKKGWVNSILGISINLVGAVAFNWKVQHNVLHHTYTNIHDADEDISPRGVLRMSPESEWKPIHQFQHIYAWFFYSLLTFVWVLFKDYARLIKYQREGFLEKLKTTPAKEWSILLITKIGYLIFIIVLPILFTPLSFGMVFLGFLLMHFVSGFILAIIFQPAHVIEGTEYPVPDTNGNLENNWAIHQLHTTTDFGQGEKLFSWYVGGLNFQVEHHLFPTICHVHYRNLAPIVKQTAEEFGIPYKAKETFFAAVACHARLLKELGKKPGLKLAHA